MCAALHTWSGRRHRGRTHAATRLQPTSGEEHTGARFGAGPLAVFEAQLVGRTVPVYQGSPSTATSSGESGHSHPPIPSPTGSPSLRKPARPASRVAAFHGKRPLKPAHLCGHNVVLVAVWDGGARLARAGGWSNFRGTARRRNGVLGSFSIGAGFEKPNGARSENRAEPNGTGDRSRGASGRRAAADIAISRASLGRTGPAPHRQGACRSSSK